MLIFQSPARTKRPLIFMDFFLHCKLIIITRATAKLLFICWYAWGKQWTTAQQYKSTVGQCSMAKTQLAAQNSSVNRLNSAAVQTDD